MAHTSRLPVCTPSLRAKTVKREASMGHITLPVDGSGRTWCSRRLACVALGDISDAELDALIIAEPEATIAERAEAQSTSPVPVSLDECTRVLAASWADEARWVARACGCTVTSVVDAAYAEAVREIRNDLLPPVPEPPP